MKRITPKPRLELPKADLGKQSKDLVKLGIGAGIGLAALGIGLAAFQAASDGG